MRFRLFLILIGVVVLSLASGLGLRYALAWTEPGADPPDGNVPKPINIGTDSQTKFGDLTIGGNFVVSKGQIVGVPGGGNMGVGTLNAEQLCIQGNCRNNWPEAVNAFVDEGNIGFGPTAILGTNDNVPLSFETNGVGRMMIGAAGNVGIGTTNTAYNLMVGGTAPKIYLLPTPGSNPELDFGSPAIDTHWSIYRDAATDQLRFWRTDNKLILTSGGNVGISTDNPLYKLTVAGTAPREYLWPSGGGNPELDFGNQAGDTHWAIYRDAATDQLRFWRGDNRMVITSGGNVGIRKTDPAFALDVVSSTDLLTGRFINSFNAGTALWAEGSGAGGKAVNAIATGTGLNYGVYGMTTSGSGWGGYFTGGQGLYASSEVVGAPAGGSKGAGTLNAESLCIQGNCLATWPAGTTPGGVNGQIQFNDVGGFSGDAGLTFDKATDALTVGGNLSIGMAAAGNDDFIYFDDGSKYVQWEDATARFLLSNTLFVQGQITGTGGLSTISGSSISATDPSNQRAVRLRHDGVSGILETSAPSGNPGNLVLQAPYVGTVVQVQDDLNVTGVLTVNGNATVLGKNVCLQDGTNCPAGGGTVQLQAATPGVQQVGNLNISGTGIFGGLKIDALSGVLKSAGGVVSGAATTTDLFEGANLYFTNARARAAISVGDGPIGYNPATGIIGFSSPMSVLYGGTGSGVLPPAGAVAYGTGGSFAFTGVGAAGQYLKSQGAGAPIWADIPSAGISGSGTTNYLAKFTAAGAIGSSLIYDNGANVTITSGNLGIGWSPIYKLDVNGSSYLGGAVTVTGDIVANGNSLATCSGWTAYAASASCPAGQLVTGVRYSASTVSVYCCEL